MKGLISKAMAACAWAVGRPAWAASAIGTWSIPCYPMRYNCMSRNEVNAAMAPQVQNGHVLDQTIWNLLLRAGDRTS